MGWWYRALTCVAAASLPCVAEAAPTASPNGMVAAGRPWARDWRALVFLRCMPLRYRAATYTRAACSRLQAVPTPTTLQNGTGAVGWPLALFRTAAWTAL